MEKRLRDLSLAKSSSDTAECRWPQSDHDIVSNPFHNSALTTVHARRTCSCEGMSARDLSGFGMKSFSQAQQRQHRVVYGGQMSPQVKQPVPARCYFPQDLLGRKGSKQLVRPIDLGLPCFQPESYASAVVSHGSISCQPFRLICASGKSFRTWERHFSIALGWPMAVGRRGGRHVRGVLP